MCQKKHTKLGGSSSNTLLCMFRKCLNSIFVGTLAVLAKLSWVSSVLLGKCYDSVRIHYLLYHWVLCNLMY